jgi:N-acyl-D-aspartate/D-glutamate deacylase
VRTATIHPLSIIASDGFDILPPAHPRSAATFSRVLRQYVREEGALDLMLALRKMTLMPAQRLEARVPAMRSKGRLRPGADADIVVFDLNATRDVATYEQPVQYSEGMRFVLVNGGFVVRDGRVVEGAVPGRPVRAPLQ